MKKIASTTKTVLSKHSFGDAQVVELADDGSVIMPSSATPAAPLASTFMEPDWEESLPAFHRCAIGLGHAVVQRELTTKLLKMNLLAEKKKEAKKDVIMGNTQEASSSTVSAMIREGIQDALKKARGRPQQAPPCRK